MSLSLIAMRLAEDSNYKLFLKENDGKRVKNPDTGREVKIVSLKGDKGKEMVQKMYQDWLKSHSDSDESDGSNTKAEKAPETKETPKAKEGPRHEVIMAKKTGGPQGSNQGGFYTGSDGVKRYVKFYRDPSQGVSEHISNKIYNDLGITAPKSELFKTEDGKMAYASEIIENEGTVQSKKYELNSAQKKKVGESVLKGFAADVLIANWDVVGLGLDNIVLKSDGEISRIDNGATFFHRAMGSMKPEAALQGVSEWTRFLDGTNPDYQHVASWAGVSRAEDIPGIKEQVSKIQSVATKAGGWHKYLQDETHLDDDTRNKMANLLELRVKKLSDLVKNL
jgi:hypothetical protein